jgi:hypothetical protein
MFRSKLALTVIVTVAVYLMGRASGICLLECCAQAQAVRVEPLDYLNRVHLAFSKRECFGLVCPRLRDPRDPNKPKPLTYDERGLTNNTCLQLDGNVVLFGSQGRGVGFAEEGGRPVKGVAVPGRDKNRSWLTIWEASALKIRVIQSVEIVVGEQTRLYDTVLVKYRLENRDAKAHDVGLRFLLNPCIGTNTGTPFHVPATATKAARVVNTMEVIPRADLPAYVQALETGDLSDPNATVAIVGLALQGFEPLEKAVICRWPTATTRRRGPRRPAGS